MNRHPLIQAAASAAWGLFAAVAAAAPSPPLSCGGQPGVGGCPPFVNINYTDAAGNTNLYEYDLPRIDVGRSLPLSDARGTADLQRGLLTAAVRQAEDTDVSNWQAVDLMSTLVDLFTLNSATALPPGADTVSILVTASAQGVGSIDTDYRVVQTYLHLGAGSGAISFDGGVLDDGRVIQAVTHVPTFQQFVVPLQVYANLTVRVGVPFELNMLLRTIVVESAFLNFDSFLGLAHGAQLSFVLPPGFSVTSMGGFDSASAVPEPPAPSLWLAGLGMLGLVRRRLRRGACGVGLAALLAAGSAQAGLIGDTVSAQLVDLAGAGGVSTQFASSAVVGAGPEFVAIWNYTPLNQVWQVVLDIDDSGFSIAFTDIGGGNNHDLSGFTFLGLRLGDLDPGGVVSGVSVLGGDAAVQSIGFSDHGITVQWNGFLFRDAGGGALATGRSVFDIQATTPLPEPGSAALLLAGLAGVVLVTRRRLR